MHKNMSFVILAATIGVAVTNVAFGQGGGGPSATGADLSELVPASQLYAQIETAPSPSFRRHVMTLMSRNGCSGRECHGSFQGRGGFTLSLFGYDFAKDHKEITADPDDGVRVDLENPEQSLVLLKPTMQKKHKGKLRFEKESWQYNLILKWIREGAENDAEATGSFGHLVVEPSQFQFAKAGEQVQLRVIAHWDDGAAEDVTDLTRFRTNDESIAEVSTEGLVTSKSPGDTHIVAFYDNGVVPVEVLLPLSERTESRYPTVKTSSEVDERVVAKLAKLGIIPSKTCTDAEFLRRVSLDLTGTLPSPSEIEAFLKERGKHKRRMKIDELLNSPGYSAWWATKICDFTGNNANNINDRYFRKEISVQWYDWVREKIKENEPYDELVAGMVMATGRSDGQSYEDYATEMSSYLRKDQPSSFASRATMPHYWSRRNVRQPQEKALDFAHAFLGVRIQCAQCHKHPFDQWTQQDYKQFQAFFEPIRYGQGPVSKGAMTAGSLRKDIEKKVGYNPKSKDKDAVAKKRREVDNEIKRRVAAGEAAPWQELYIVKPRPTGSKQSKNSRNKKRSSSRVITPKILGGEEVHLTDYKDPREPLMEWLRGPQNPYFAKSFVNRVWAAYFGRGIVEPADDMNLANPPTNAELLNHLASGFSGRQFNMKWLHREILNSDTYQRSWVPNATNKHDDKNFSKFNLRRLPAEVVVDAVAQATAAPKVYQQKADNIGQRAIGPQSGMGRYGNRNNSYALTVFGKPVREMACDCERSEDPTLLQTIFTRNDPSLLSQIESGNKKSPSWIDELRQELAGKGGNEREQLVASYKRLGKQEEALKKKRPKSPRTRSSKQMKAYREQAKKWEASLAKMKTQKEALAKKIRKTPAVRKPQPKNLDTLVREVFLRTVSRPPSSTEMRLAKSDISKAPNSVDGLRDLLWVMLNTKEFLVNH